MPSKALLAAAFSLLLFGTARAELPQQSEARLMVGTTAAYAVCLLAVAKHSPETMIEDFDRVIFFLDTKYRKRWGTSLFDAYRTFEGKEPIDALKLAVENIAKSPSPDVINPMCTAVLKQIGEWTEGASVGDAVKKWLALNNICRGSTKPSESTKACAEREEVDKQLTASGWCYGEPWQHGNEMVWHPCGAHTVH
jgi:hypothetical protein